MESDSKRECPGTKVKHIYALALDSLLIMASLMYAVTIASTRYVIHANGASLSATSVSVRTRAIFVTHDELIVDLGRVMRRMFTCHL